MKHEITSNWLIMKNMEKSNSSDTMFDIVSDVQLSSFSLETIRKILEPKNPFLIVNGDVTHIKEWDILVAFFAVASTNYRNVFFVPGNWEYYSKDPNMNISRIDARLKTLETIFPNVRVMLDTYTVWKPFSLVIFGGVLWSHVSSPTKVINRPIYGNDGQLITPAEWNRRHYSTLTALEEAKSVAQLMGYRLLVVTHYSPTFKHTLSEKWKDHPDNDLYCTDLEHYFSGVDEWVYGHTGLNCDVDINGMRLVSNQYDVKTGPAFSKDVAI